MTTLLPLHVILTFFLVVRHCQLNRKKKKTDKGANWITTGVVLGYFVTSLSIDAVSLWQDVVANGKSIVLQYR